MRVAVFSQSCMYALLVLGIFISASSAAAAYLEPRDFITALFAERGSEQIGLGIQGLQLFHCLVGGIAVSALSGGFLAVRKDENPFSSISLDSLSQTHTAALSTGTMKSIESAMGSIIRTEEDSDLAREIAAFKSRSPRNNGTKPIPESQKIDPKSVETLIFGASSLLADKRRITDGSDTDIR